MLSEKIGAKGHMNVLAEHPTTLEITKDPHLTLKGDCIIAVSADKGPKDFSTGFLEALRSENARLEISMICGGVTEKVTAFGHPGLSFTNQHEMVVRKSNYICPRTLAIKADKSSKELSREFVNKLKESRDVFIELTVYDR